MTIRASSPSSSASARRCAPRPWPSPGCACAQHATAWGFAANEIVPLQIALGQMALCTCRRCACAAHRRLVRIHPLSDGNGRVARLGSYAMLLDTRPSRSVLSRFLGQFLRHDGSRNHSKMGPSQGKTKAMPTNPLASLLASSLGPRLASSSRARQAATLAAVCQTPPITG